MGCCGQQLHDGRVLAVVELTVIGAENGGLVVVDSSGTRYRVPITEALHAALRQTRPAAPAAHRVGPRDVQALIRSGLSAAEVVAQTGESIEYVQRFEGPVLAEREYVITAARAVPVAVGDDSEPLATTRTFGTVIDSRLDDLGARSAVWTSRKKGSHWVVEIGFLDDDVERSAQWTFDPKKSALVPANHEAQSLSQQGEVPTQLLPRLRAVPAEQGPQTSRFDSGAFAGAGMPTRGSEPMDRPRSLALDPDTADTQEVGQTADLLEALRRRRGEREAAPVEEWESARAAHPSTGSIRIVESLTDDSIDADDEGIDDLAPVASFDARPASPPATTDTANEGDVGQSTAPATPSTPTKSATRRGRAAMPSWDEIVFGARPDDDPS